MSGLSRLADNLKECTVLASGVGGFEDLANEFAAVSAELKPEDKPGCCASSSKKNKWNSNVDKVAALCPKVNAKMNEFNAACPVMNYNSVPTENYDCSIIPKKVNCSCLMQMIVWMLEVIVAVAALVVLAYAAAWTVMFLLTALIVAAAAYLITMAINEVAKATDSTSVWSELSNGVKGWFD